MAPAHRPVGRNGVEEAERHRFDGEGHGPARQLAQDAVARDLGIDRAGERERRAEQDGSQGDDGPVDQHAPENRSFPLHPPNLVERRVDGGKQHDRGEGEAEDADAGRLARVLHETGQRRRHRRARLGHEIAQHEALDAGVDVLEAGKSGEDAEGQRQEGHHGQKRRVAERGGQSEAAVPLEAAQRVPDQAAPLPHPPAGVVENRHSAPLQEPSTRLPREERLGR